MWSKKNINNSAFLIEAENSSVLSLLGVDYILSVNGSNISACSDVLVNNLGEVDVCNNITVGKHYIVSVGIVDEIEHAVESFESASVDTALNVAERREKVKTADFSCHIPVTAAAEVVEQGLVVGLCNNTNFVNSAVYHIGKREVDKTVTSAEKHGAHSSFLSKIRNCAVVHI